MGETTFGQADEMIGGTRRIRAALGPAALANRPALEKRYPEIFTGSRARRAATIGVIVGLLAALALAVVVLDFSVGRIWSGLGQLVHFTTLMVPPSPGTWSRFHLFVQADRKSVV
jgi:phosphonate transport system permease protein